MKSLLAESIAEGKALRLNFSFLNHHISLSDYGPAISH